MKYKLKVEREFRDKNTNKVHKVGKTLTVDEVRAKELLVHPQGIVSILKMLNTKPNDKPKTSDETDNDGNDEGKNEPEKDGDGENEGNKGSE